MEKDAAVKEAKAEKKADAALKKKMVRLQYLLPTFHVLNICH